jgi:hypothetical protein
MRARRFKRILAAACALALLALALMAWSLLDPRPVPVILAMSLGQGLGTLSLIAFLTVVAADLKRAPLAPPGDSSIAKPSSGNDDMAPRSAVDSNS